MNFLPQYTKSEVVNIESFYDFLKKKLLLFDFEVQLGFIGHILHSTGFQGEIAVGLMEFHDDI